ncbi:MAG: glycosyltransferase [Acetobacteraceae bacterium]|nr:glycosyltransferase [Acetobacteraceae bacterium]
MSEPSPDKGRANRHQLQTDTTQNRRKTVIGQTLRNGSFGKLRTVVIVFVDDRAKDGAWTVLRELAQTDPRVVAIRMSRNVGQQLAITAGIEQCAGNRAVVMDCDLQDPPEAIPALYARAREGFDIVFAKRKSDHQSAGRVLANRLYFAMLGFVSGRPFDGELGAFSIISRRTMQAFLQFSERDRHYLMILYEVGFESSVIEYERAIRRSGQSSYSISDLLAHALSGLFFTTTRLLYWVIYAGTALAGSGVLLAFTLVLQFYVGGAMPGWTSLIVVQLVVGGVIALCVGVTGLYVGRIFEEVQRRPLYFVQDRLDHRVRADIHSQPFERADLP